MILWLLGAGIGHAEETDHIKTLTVEEATRLAQQKNGRLLLDGRTTPALKAVAALAEMNGHNWNGHLPRFKAVPDGMAVVSDVSGRVERTGPVMTAKKTDEGIEVRTSSYRLLLERAGGCGSSISDQFRHLP